MPHTRRHNASTEATPGVSDPSLRKPNTASTVVATELCAPSLRVLTGDYGIVARAVLARCTTSTPTMPHTAAAPVLVVALNALRTNPDACYECVPPLVLVLWTTEEHLPRAWARV